MKKTKIAIIGANSYIGRNLIKVLHDEYTQFQLVLYDCQNSQLDGVDNYRSINILDKSSVERIDFDCDVVFMLVGKTGTTKAFEDYETYININEIGLLNVLDEYVRQNSTAKIMFPSTRLIYKGSNDPLVEDSPKEFKTIYSINKYACEQYIKTYSNVFGVKYCILRICVPFGSLLDGVSSYGTAEFMINSSINKHLINIYGDGSQRRTITHIYDLCKTMILSAVNEKCVNDIYNVGGEDYSLLQMAKMISNMYHSNVAFVPYPSISRIIETGSTVFDSAKLDKLIAYKRTKSFEEWINNND